MKLLQKIGITGLLMALVMTYYGVPLLWYVILNLVCLVVYLGIRLYQLKRTNAELKADLKAQYPNGYISYMSINGTDVTPRRRGGTITDPIW